MPRRTWLPIAVGVLAATGLEAQTVKVSRLDESTYRYAVTEERRSIFAANLALGPEERERFWTIYDEYGKEREPLDKERFSLLQRYAQSYANLSDDQATVKVVESAPACSAPCTAPAAPPSDCISAISGTTPQRFVFPLLAHSSHSSAMVELGVIG